SYLDLVRQIHSRVQIADAGRLPAVGLGCVPVMGMGQQRLIPLRHSDILDERAEQIGQRATDGVAPEQLIERKEDIGPSRKRKDRAVMEFDRVFIARKKQAVLAL